MRTHPRTRLLTSHAFQQKMASARGRPRGKVRGIPQQPAESGKQHQAQRAHKTPKDEAGLNVYLESLNEGNLASFGSMFTNMVIDYSSSDRRLQEAVDLIFTKTTKDRENASFGAKICSLIVEPGESTAEPIDTTERRTKFRKALLQKFQTDYKNRQSIRSQSIEAWLAVYTFLYELFLRVQVQGQPIKVVGGAISSASSWLLNIEDCDDDEIECVCTCLKLVGHLLEQTSSDQVKEIVRLLRTKAISRQSSSRVRCLILEVLEYQCIWLERFRLVKLINFTADLPDAIAERSVEFTESVTLLL